MNSDPNNPAALDLPGLAPAASEANGNGGRIDHREGTADSEELSYDFVPPRKTVTVAVRYRIRGRGRPLPYPVDEGDGQ